MTKLGEKFEVIKIDPMDARKFLRDGSVVELATKYNCSISGLRKWLKRNKIEVPKKIKYN